MDVIFWMRKHARFFSRLLLENDHPERGVKIKNLHSIPYKPLSKKSSEADFFDFITPFYFFRSECKMLPGQKHGFINFNINQYLHVSSEGYHQSCKRIAKRQSTCN